jgi:hypothetical protein
MDGAGGSGGSGAGGSTIDSGSDGMVLDAPGDAGSGCPAGAALCEDFESFADGATTLAPKWEAYTLMGTVKVDGSKPHAGTRALHVTTVAGAAHFADIIRQSQDNTAVVPLVHYGRVMLWTSHVPDGANGSHWGINHASGPTATDRNAQLKYSHGGQFGKLFAGYSQRERPVNPDGTFPPRGGGAEPNDPPTTVDCSQRAASAVLPLNKWVCWEWKFDATNNETQLWVDSQPINDLDVKERGSACVNNTDSIWQGPVLFNKLILGFDQYQDAPAQEFWFDDLVISTARVGCP